jgi:hypothetical protein
VPSKKRKRRHQRAQSLSAVRTPSTTALIAAQWERYRRGEGPHPLTGWAHAATNRDFHPEPWAPLPEPDNLTAAIDRGEVTAMAVSMAMQRGLTTDEQAIVRAEVARHLDQPEPQLPPPIPGPGKSALPRDAFTDEVLARMHAETPLRLLNVEVDDDGLVGTFEFASPDERHQYVTPVDGTAVSIGPFDPNAGWVLGDRWPMPEQPSEDFVKLRGLDRQQVHCTVTVGTGTPIYDELHTQGIKDARDQLELELHPEFLTAWFGFAWGAL